MVFLELLSLVEEDNLASSFSSSSFLLLFLLLLLLLLEAVAVEIPFICRVIRCRVPVAANSKLLFGQMIMMMTKMEMLGEAMMPRGRGGTEPAPAFVRGHRRKRVGHSL